jgi:dolichyl-phosphate-mannose-protein mannosyltransferase
MLDFSLLTKSGAGDAFMSPGFQKTLEGSQYSDNANIQASNIFEKFYELNAEMYKANQGLTATHPYSSQWFSWPLMLRPIYYWVNGNSRIYLLGNPVIWWASTIAILMLIMGLIKDRWQRVASNKIKYLFVGAYILNMLPFIGVNRVMFLYHYFTAYIFAILVLVWLISQNKNYKNIFIALLIASAVSFVFFAPLTYGLNLSPRAYEARVWLESWR